MKIHVDCIPCFVRQSLEAAKDLGLDEDAAARLMRSTLSLALQLDWSLPPPVMGRRIHRAIREITGDPDPYLRSKVAATEVALRLLPGIEATIAGSDDPFQAAVKVSIAGNVIDLGAKAGREIDVEKTCREAFDVSIDHAGVAALRRTLSEARTVLFLADNAGEIVCDRPLLEQIGRDKVVVAVRGSPTINDATLADAERSGLTERFRVVSNGTDMPGTWLDDCSPELVELFRSADVVMAKGQGNFETLSDQKRTIFFLLMAKCSLVAEKLGVPVGTCVLRESAAG
jgi:damage-control phosphatase, subfamily I